MTDFAQAQLKPLDEAGALLDSMLHKTSMETGGTALYHGKIPSIGWAYLVFPAFGMPVVLPSSDEISPFASHLSSS